MELNNREIQVVDLDELAQVQDFSRIASHIGGIYRKYTLTS